MFSNKRVLLSGLVSSIYDCYIVNEIFTKTPSQQLEPRFNDKGIVVVCDYKE